MYKRFMIRRAIIAILGRYTNPQALETVLLAPEFYSIFGTAELPGDAVGIIAEEWRSLTELGYLKTVPGFDDYRGLTVIGREFAERPAKMNMSAVFAGGGC